MNESTKPRPPRSKPARSPASAFLANAAAVKRQTLTFWRDVVSRRPLAQQREWVSTREALQFMGAAWCRRQRGELDTIERRLKSRVPSGAWFDAVWNDGHHFPPQEPFCPLAVVAQIYGAAAAGRVRPSRVGRLLDLVRIGLDVMQLFGRPGSRMTLSTCHSAFGSGAYADREPVPFPASQRITPPQSVGVDVPGSEDWFDRLTPAFAAFVRDPESPSAAAIRRIGELRGRDSGAERAARKKARRLELKRLAAIKAKLGVNVAA